MLFGRSPIEDKSYYGEDVVWYPHGEHWGPSAIGGEGGGDGLEEDVAEAECQAEAEREAHASLALLAGERHADDGEDEGCEGGGEALVILYLKGTHVGRAAKALLVDVLAYLRGGHGLLLIAGVEEVLRLYGYDSVELQA